MMGISPEHLGAQVQCPHCQAIVQTPAPLSAGIQPAADSPPPVPEIQIGEQESIFSAPEPSDDLFGGSSVPKIEMPPMDLPPPRLPVSSTAPTVTMEPTPPAYEPSAPDTAFQQGPPPAASDDLAALTPPRRVVERSMFMPILLIFLVPYAIFTTAFIGYLLYTWPRDNPLKNLPDNAPKGQPRFQVKHDYDLDRDMKTALGQPIRVGALEVTPLKVKHTADKDLVLVFRAKNVSSNQVFNPIADDFLKYSRKSLDSGKPYTFLERVSKQKPPPPRIYGGTLEQFKGPSGAEKRLDPDVGIGPGEDALIHLISEPGDHAKVPDFLKAKEPLVWRVQVRQGLVNVDGKDVSVTTVIGVEFTSSDIVRDKS